MTNDLLIYVENICAFPHILGSPSSYMTLHPSPSEFPYTVYAENLVFFFISVPPVNELPYGAGCFGKGFIFILPSCHIIFFRLFVNREAHGFLHLKNYF